jgi:hypothetical protein
MDLFTQLLAYSVGIVIGVGIALLLLHVITRVVVTAYFVTKKEWERRKNHG